MHRLSWKPERLLLLTLTTLLFALVGGGIAAAQMLQGDILAHDPSFIREGDCSYVFSTGHGPFNDGTIMIRMKCDDSDWWDLVGTVFDQQPEWISQTLGAYPENLWAPHISYHDGTYFLYYAASIPGTNNSLIGLAINSTLDPFSPDYEWIDQGLVLRSQPGNNFNAIDPFVFWDDGEAWLLFGAGYDGIKMRRLNPRTGLLDTTVDPTIHSLVRRSGGIGGAALLHRDGYYYLIWYYDICCQGFDSTVNLRVARSTEVTGPYVDREGNPTITGGGTLILGRGEHPSQDGGTVMVGGAGGPDIYRGEDGWLMIFHWYPEWESHQMSIVEITWTEDGWPVLGPMS